MPLASCPTEAAPADPVPLIVDGQLVIKTHDIGWIVCGLLALIALVTSGWHISKHLQSYTSKEQQRLVVRLLFMVPLYSVTTFLSYLFYDNATSILLFRDSYESVLLVSFFYLLLLYLGETGPKRASVFHTMDTQTWKWLWPLTSVKWRPKDGSQFLYLMKWGVLQYCLLQPLTSLLAVIFNAVGLYCDDSWSPVWAHIYLTGIQSVSVTVAMYTLLQLYIVLSPLLKDHAPILKFVSVKAIVFLEFWQDVLLSALQDFGVIKGTQYWTADEVNVGISALLQTFEMVLIAFLHIKAFSYHPYQSSTGEHTSSWKAFLHAFDFRDLLREIWDGCKWFVTRHTDRHVDLWMAMGKMRGAPPGTDVWDVLRKGPDTAQEPTLPILGFMERDSDGTRGEPEPTLPLWTLEDLIVPASSFRAPNKRGNAAYTAISLDDVVPTSSLVSPTRHHELIGTRYPLFDPQNRPRTMPVPAPLFFSRNQGQWSRPPASSS